MVKILSFPPRPFEKKMFYKTFFFLEELTAPPAARLAKFLLKFKMAPIGGHFKSAALLEDFRTPRSETPSGETQDKTFLTKLSLFSHTLQKYDSN